MSGIKNGVAKLIQNEEARVIFMPLLKPAAIDIIKKMQDHEKGY